jgi:hypothetical protein
LHQIPDYDIFGLTFQSLPDDTTRTVAALLQRGATQNRLILGNPLSGFWVSKFQRFSMRAEMAFLGKLGRARCAVPVVQQHLRAA